MEEKRKNKKIIGIVGAIAIIFLIVVLIIINTQKQSIETKQIKLGDIVILNDNDKQLLRNKTIENINNNLKSPATANYEESFHYLCKEPNIVEIEGYVDSQNSFGTILRSEFICEYFVVDNLIDTLVYLKLNDTEILDIKDTYIGEYKKQANVNELKQEGNKLDQNKLEYIMSDFNNNEWNNVGKILKAQYEENETKVDVKITAKSSKTSREERDYWTNFNICSILHYFNEFDIVGTVKMDVYDINNKKIVELDFDDDFIKNTWKNNSQIDLVKELFGKRYTIVK